MSDCQGSLKKENEEKKAYEAHRWQQLNAVRPFLRAYMRHRSLHCNCKHYLILHRGTALDLLARATA